VPAEAGDVVTMVIVDKLTQKYWSVRNRALQVQKSLLRSWRVDTTS